MSNNPTVSKSCVPSTANPSPQPERAIYGFFLLSSAIISFTIFLLISYLPNSTIKYLGWDYLPDSYWSIAIPAYIVVLVLMILPVYMALNIRKVNEIESMSNVKDEFTLEKKNETKGGEKSDSIEPVYDLDISEICQYLYLEK